jgi:hypothetical protein
VFSGFSVPTNQFYNHQRPHQAIGHRIAADLFTR